MVITTPERLLQLRNQKRIHLDTLRRILIVDLDAVAVQKEEYEALITLGMGLSKGILVYCVAYEK